MHTPTGRRPLPWVFLAGLVSLGLTGLTPASSSETRPLNFQEASAEPLEVLFTYGSEKEEWINDVTAVFDNCRILWGAEGIIRNRPPRRAGTRQREAPPA